MLAALIQSLGNVLVLVAVAGVGYWLSFRGHVDDKGRSLIAKTVNTAIPFFLFYSVTSKFTHDKLIELLQMGFLPFVVVFLNWCLSKLLVRLGMVPKEREGAFIACFTSSTVLFVGLPLGSALFGDVSIPYLLVYFFANCLFIWTVGLYNIQIDGVRKHGGAMPGLVSSKSLKMLVSPPLLGFLLGITFILGDWSVPKQIADIAGMIGRMTTPLALVFIGMTVYKTGFSKLRHMERELWLILVACFVARPLIMYLLTCFIDMDDIMRKVFILASSLPVSSVIAVLARNYGADDEYASEAIGVSTIGLVFALPVIVLAVNFI